jgi:predicted ribosome quality control (RQC) complex YloA/Tae2 family protein
MFDSIALRAITDELNATILHGRIQDVIQMDALTFGFEIYAQHQRHYLYVTVRADQARVHLIAEKLRGAGDSPAAFYALLRKYAEGAIVNAIVQLPNERVLKIRLDHSSEGISTLVVETIGKYSNLILLDADERVLDAVKRVSHEINRTREILPKHPYAPPPPQAKLDPTLFSVSALVRVLDDNSDSTLWSVLVKSVAGVSPLFARELAFRVAGKADVLCDSKYAEDLAVTLGRLMRGPWQPTIAFEEGEPAAFAPYPLTHLFDLREFASIGSAIEAFYGTPESYVAVKAPLRVQLADARDKLARKRDALTQEQSRAGNVETLRMNGEMILAYAHQIIPGQERLLAETENGLQDIPLEPTLSAVENAQKCFKAYRHAKDAAARIPALLTAAKTEVEYAEQMLNDLDLAENRGEIDAVIQAAREAGLMSEKQKRGKVTQGEPRLYTSGDGFTILVGKNARQNEEITFKRAKAEDLWLHVRDYAGAHVVIVRAGREVLESTLREAAALAAQFSQARDEGSVEVIVAPRKNVHRVRGGRPGMVNVRDERTISVDTRQRKTS